MTNPIAVSQRATASAQALQTYLSIRGIKDGEIQRSFARFEAEIRADATEVERERAVKVADQRVQLLHDLDGPMAQMRAREASLIATAIHNQRDHDHE